MKTAIYARISEDRQNGAGVERQLEDCLALADRKGWDLTPTPYIDNDISASRYSRQRRPEYRNLLAAIREGKVNRIVAWHVDRLYRQPKELEELIGMADAGQVEIVSVTGGDLDLGTSDGRLVARMLVSVAAKSSEDTSGRILRQQLQARQAGKPTGGRKPFGWLDQVTPDPAESLVLLEAMDRVLAGASLNDVAREWTATGVHGRQWNSSDVSSTLTMPRHAGLVVHRGEIVGLGQWPALLPRARWEQVCAAVSGRARNVGVPRRRSMLTGIVVCGACGASMTRSSGVGGVRLWRCHVGPRNLGCGKVSIRAEQLEPVIVHAVWQRVDTLDLAAILSDVSDRPDYANVAQDLAELEAREDEAAASFGAGRINVRAMERITYDLEAQRTVLRARLARDANRDALSTYAGRTGALRAAWPLLTDDQRRTIIAETLGKVTILPASGSGPRFDPSRIVLGV
jgi:DNA invertase Pin-like site-specific DNA recombinase